MQLHGERQLIKSQPVVIKYWRLGFVARVGRQPEAEIIREKSFTLLSALMQLALVLKTADFTTTTKTTTKF